MQGPRPWAGRVWVGALAALLVGGTGPANAHVAIGRATLRQYVQHSSSVVVAEIASPLRMWTAPDGRDRQAYWSVRRLDGIRGPGPPDRFDVFSHAEGLPHFERGDRVLLFLEPTAREPELESLAPHLPWYTLQGPGHEWRCAAAPIGDADPDSPPDAVVAAARGWAAWLELPPDEQPARMRELLLAEIRSPHPRLREDGVVELGRVAANPRIFPSEAELAPFVALAASPGLPVSQRLALLVAMDANPAWDAGETWRSLVAEPHDAESIQRLAPAAGARPDPVVSAQLRRWLAHDDARVRRAAAGGLGRPWHAGSEPALSRAAADADPGVARAAIGALARLGTSDAAAALERLADGPEPDRARWAAAALRTGRPPVTPSPRGRSDPAGADRPIDR